MEKMRTRFLPKMTHDEVCEYVKRNDIIYVPFGTVEVHGTFPLDVETTTPEAFALLMAEETDGLVLGNLLNAAHAVGVGSCWIHRAREEFDSEEGRALLREWGIEGDYAGIGHCILGVPASGNQPEAKPRKAGYVTYVK